MYELDDAEPKPRRNKRSRKFTQDNEARRRSRESIGPVPGLKVIPDKRRSNEGIDEIRAAKRAGSGSAYLEQED